MRNFLALFSSFFSLFNFRALSSDSKRFYRHERNHVVAVPRGFFFCFVLF